MDIVQAGDDLSIQTAVLDALPYIDPERSEQLKRQVNQLVEEEMKNFQAQDYLAHIPMPQYRISESVILSNAFERMRQGRELNALDRTRYDVLGPTKEQVKALGAWKSEVTNVMTRISEQDENLVNLQLCKDFGIQSWKYHAMEMKKIEEWINKETQHAKDSKDDINRKRKHDQTQKKGELDQLESEWWSLVTRNNETELAIELAERKVKRLKMTAQKRGIAVS